MKKFNKLNIYLSMTKDGHFALSKILKSKKKIDLIITLCRKDAYAVSDYKDFSDINIKYKIPIIYTKNINSLESKFVMDRPNILIVNGWSQLIKKSIINSCINGCVGTHPSLLPKNRGRAPVAWHFINEEKYGGITLFYLNEGCDSGPIIAQEKFRLSKEDNASSYYKKITILGSKLLLENFDAINDGSAKKKAIEQNHKKANYLSKRAPKDSYIDFNQKSSNIVNLIKAVTDIYPLCFFYYKNNVFYIKKGFEIKNISSCLGPPGKIAQVNKRYVCIFTKDGIIRLTEIYQDNRAIVNLRALFKEGEILNE